MSRWGCCPCLHYRAGAATAAPSPMPQPPPHSHSNLHITQTHVHLAPPPPHCRAALFFRLKQKGFQECTPYSQAYAACCSGRVLSVAWACRGEMKALSDCMGMQ